MNGGLGSVHVSFVFRDKVSAIGLGQRYFLFKEGTERGLVSIELITL